MTPRPLSVLVLVSLLTLGCASRDSGIDAAFVTGDATYSSTDAYDLKIAQTAAPMSFPKADKGSIDVNFDITIRNASPKPVTIDRISLQSMGGSLYRLDTSSRQYKLEIAAGQTHTFKFWAPAHVSDTTIEARAPMVVRALVDTIVDGQSAREVFNREVNGSFAIGARAGS